MADEQRVTGRTRNSACGWYVMRSTPSTLTERAACVVGRRSLEKLGGRGWRDALRVARQEGPKLCGDLRVPDIERVRRFLLLWGQGGASSVKRFSAGGAGECMRFRTWRRSWFSRSSSCGGVTSLGKSSCGPVTCATYVHIISIGKLLFGYYR